MKKVRLGLIGAGGRATAHMVSWMNMRDEVEVVAIADPIREKCEIALQYFPGARLYENHTQLFENESKNTLDAVVIAVEPTAHTDIEERAIDAGLPFIIEKPMTLDLEQAERINKAIAEKGLITCAGFQDRYFNLMEMIKEELPKHKTGGIVVGSWIGGIPKMWWWQKKSTCGGQLVEQNIHLIDGLRWLYGEPLSVYATSSRGMVVPGVDASEEYDTDDHSTVVIRFENSVTATLVSGCYSKSVRPKCGLYIILDDMVIDYALRDHLDIITKDGTTTTPRYQGDHTRFLDNAFIEAVRTGDPSGIRSPYSDAIKSLKLAFAANKSMETGEVIYF